MHASALPVMTETAVDFRDTSFFQCPQGGNPSAGSRQLPAPDEVRVKSNGQRIVKFEQLGLVVKFGLPPVVTLVEARNMQTIRHMFPNNEIPVPEIFGWRVELGQVYIYMSLIPGLTLGKIYPSLIDSEKEMICRQLRSVVAALKSVRQEPSDQFIGKSPPSNTE